MPTMAPRARMATLVVALLLWGAVADEPSSHAVPSAPPNGGEPSALLENDFPRRAFPAPTATPINPTNPTAPLSLSPVADPVVDLASHRREHARLSAEKTELTTQLREARMQLEVLEMRIFNEQRFYEETHASVVVRNAMPSPRGAVLRPLECQGWKKTGRCTPRGERRPLQDRSCLDEIQGGAAGYCEVRDAATNEFFKVMRVGCETLPTSVSFWCELAPQFANVPAEIERAVVAQARAEAAAPKQTVAAVTRGIVMAVTSSQLGPLERTIRVLRSLGCALPIEVWYFEVDMAAHAKARGSRWAPTDPHTEMRPLTTLPFTLTTTKYASIHAVVHSKFSQLLYLDSATEPLRDPTYLFSLPEFQSTGTVFWPDVVHAQSPTARVVANSLLWELLDMPFVSMFEQDDRQVLINREVPRVRTALRVLKLFSEQRPSLFYKFELVDGTKDFARLAWLKTRAAFYMVAVPPTLGGVALAGDGRFCGTHVVQHGPSGEELFVHRQRSHVEDAPDQGSGETVITLAQVFDWRQTGESDLMRDYDVRSFEASVSGRQVTCLAHESRHEKVATKPWREKTVREE